METKTPKLKSILLVDDDHSNNFLNKIFISQLHLDAEVSIALNGKEALDHIQNKLVTPCLLILDLQMPVMDGWEFLDAYHEEIPQKVKDQIVIHIITISDDKVDASRARKNPYIKRLVQKPVTDLKFKKLVKKSC